MSKIDKIVKSYTGSNELSEASLNALYYLVDALDFYKKSKHYIYGVKCKKTYSTIRKNKAKRNR